MPISTIAGYGLKIAASDLPKHQGDQIGQFRIVRSEHSPDAIVFADWREVRSSEVAVGVAPNFLLFREDRAYVTLREKMWDLFEPMGLWVEKNYGIWVVLDTGNKE